MKANNNFKNLIKLNKNFNTQHGNILISLIQFIKYCFVGGIATIFDWGTYSFFLFILHVNYQISTIFGFILGLIINYFLSKKIVFKEKSKVGKYEFGIYALIGIIGLLFTSGLMYLFVGVLVLNPLISRIITTILVLIWNFIGRKLLY